ncbi:MAG: Maf family nucleotide pyrophosphatase [Gammaproteobacteria bacterium]
MKTLVLASTSPYRREILERIGIPFETASPNVDETVVNGETPEQLVKRLAEAKARAVSETYPGALVIGSDQVAVLDNQILGKPGNHGAAVEQLSNASGKKVLFLTGLCLLNVETNKAQINVDKFSVEFRQLSKSQIENYLQREKPYDCAGSFKSEGLGISLFKKMEGDDPNALIGLSLITLINMLSVEGVEVLGK